MQADIWGVGCLLLEMLTGRVPWHELNCTGYPLLLRIAQSEAWR